MSKLSEIINNTNKSPTIINEASNFVIVTYWWGRGNFNQNTARPCISFYEDVIKKVTRYFINMINTITRKLKDNNLIPIVIKNIFKSYREGLTTFDYDQIIKKTAFQYISSLYAYCNIVDNKLSDKEKNDITREVLEKNKLLNKTPTNFIFKNRVEVENILFSIVKYAILINETEIIQLYLINDEISELMKENVENNENIPDYNLLKKKIKDLYDKKKSINNKINDYKSNYKRDKHTGSHIAKPWRYSGP